MGLFFVDHAPLGDRSGGGTSKAGDEDTTTGTVELPEVRLLSKFHQDIEHNTEQLSGQSPCCKKKWEVEKKLSSHVSVTSIVEQKLKADGASGGRHVRAET